MKMKYRTNQTEIERVAQEFSPFVQNYKINEATGVLEATGQTDIQEFVQSSENCALAKVLESLGYDESNVPMFYLPQVDISEGVSEVSDYSEGMFPSSSQNVRSQLDISVESLRQKYNLDPAKYSISDTIKYAREELEKELLELQAKQQQQQKTDLGGVTNGESENNGQA